MGGGGGAIERRELGVRERMGGTLIVKRRIGKGGEGSKDREGWHTHRGKEGVSGSRGDQDISSALSPPPTQQPALEIPLLQNISPS